MDKIRRLCTIAFVFVIPVMLWSFYNGVWWALDNALLDPQKWYEHRWVHPDAVIAPTTRWVFLGVWLMSPVFGFIAYLSAIGALVKMRAGELFDLGTARWIFLTGFWLSVSAVAQIFGGCVSPMIRSWHNPEGPLPLRYWASAESHALVFCGLGFVLLGLVMREAIKLARENEAFV